MSLVTPLNRVLGLGTAKGAAEHWWTQRLTAVALVPLGLWFVIAVAALPDHGYDTVLAWAERPLTSILLLLFVLAVGYHSYLGVQVVIEDYVTSKAPKVLALMGRPSRIPLCRSRRVFAILRIAFGPAA